MGVRKTRRWFLGGNNMRDLAKICAVVAICFGASGNGLARSRSGLDLSKVDLSMPFVALSIPRTPLRLGEISGPGLKQLDTKVTARVVANCRCSIMVSFQGLTHEAGRVAILPKHMTVEINGKTPVGTERVRVASLGPTNLSGVDVPIELKIRVKGSPAYPAGRYCGNLVVTVMAVP
ncbi:MAG: hypothetical protein A2Y76_09710 [Planctomycetes bacterium RBG_13_60_9]|nr:MAG: hypothetical protein A2Y76_09710 [Planctomycetes bacterium RBG_13_60_9]